MYSASFKGSLGRSLVAEPNCSNVYLGESSSTKVYLVAQDRQQRDDLIGVSQTLSKTSADDLMRGYNCA
jgi:hypothetical protein